RVAAVDAVDHAELLELLARLAKLADRCAIQFQLEDLAVEERILGWVRVGAEQILVRAGRDADAASRADAFDLALDVAIVVEHLDARIAHVGDVDVAGGVNGDRGGNVELPRSRADAAPLLDVFSGLVELR